MLIFKSFIRKKTTKVYLILFSLLLSSIFLLLSFKGYYIMRLKENYKGSYIGIVMDKNNFSKLNKIKNIDNITTFLVGDIKSEYIDYLVLNSSLNLKDNEIILSEHFISEYEIKDNLNVIINNEDTKFIVKDFTEGNVREAFISKALYEKLYNLSSKLEYHLTLEDWSFKDKTIKELTKKIAIDDNYGLTVFNISEKNSNINNIMAILNLILGVIIFIFFIIYVICIINTIVDEKNINKLYQDLGFNQKLIMKINNLKIILLLIISSIISVFGYLIMKYIFKLFKIYLNLEITYLLKILVLLLLVNIIFNIIFKIRKVQK